MLALSLDRLPQTLSQGASVSVVSKSIQLNCLYARSDCCCKQRARPSVTIAKRFMQINQSTQKISPKVYTCASIKPSVLYRGILIRTHSRRGAPARRRRSNKNKADGAFFFPFHLKTRTSWGLFKGAHMLVVRGKEEARITCRMQRVY